ncbi:hypothetical protein D3C73_1066420 [compost metagenome]
MVPLPEILQLHLAVLIRLIHEIIAANQRLVGVFRPGAGDFDGTRSFCRKYRKIILEAKRNQHGNASDRTVVLEQNRIPASVRGIHDSSLRNAGIEITHIIVEDLAAGKFTFKRIRHEAGLGSPRMPGFQDMNEESIVFAVDFVKVGAFITQMIFRSLAYNGPV